MVFSLILIILLMVAWMANKIWYNKLSEKDKSIISQLDLTLKKINCNSQKSLPPKYMYALQRYLFNLSKNLVNDEEILFFCKYNLKDFCYVTNKKLLINHKDNYSIIPFEKVNSISTGKTWIEINNNSSILRLPNITNNNILKLKEFINDGMENHQNISIDITKVTEKDIADKIARLKALCDEGVLTEYEFNMKKLELLNK